MKDLTTKSLAGKLILTATILASGMAFLDGSVVNIAVPTMQRQLNTNLIGMQWVLNGYALMLCSLLLTSGALGDRFGRKKIFSLGIGVFITASFLCGFSHTIGQLVLFRIIQGIGAAMMIPGSLSIIESSFQEAVKGRAIGLWSGFAGGLATLGPLAGGWLVQYLGWPAIFYINVPIGILALLITWKYVPESRNNEATRIDFAGATVIFLSLLGLAYALISAPQTGWTNPITLVSFIGGIILFFIFFLIEKKNKEPLVPFRMFSPLVTGANLATLLLYFALGGVIFFLVLNLQQIQQYPPLTAGLAMLPSVLLITFLSGVGGIITDTIGPRIPMILGPLIVASGILFFVFSGIQNNYFTTYFPGLILMGLGMSLVIAPLTKSALAVEKKYSGAASGVNNAVAGVARLLAVALLGFIVLTLFQQQLYSRVSQIHATQQQQNQIILQATKLGGIIVPKNVTQQQRQTMQIAIDQSFLYSFRWAMGICVFLAFMSSVISFFTIHNKKTSNRSGSDKGRSKE